MSMTIHLDKRMNKKYQANERYESLCFTEAVLVTDFPIREHKVILKLLLSAKSLKKKKN